MKRHYPAGLRTRYLFCLFFLSALVFDGEFAQKQGAIFTLSALPAAFAQGQAEQRPAFFRDLGDIPLMPGLYETENGTVVFDKADGRIAETHAQTEELTPAAIRAFYETTMPHLGWKRVGDLIFERENERLEITIIPQEGWQFVRVMISPQRS